MGKSAAGRREKRHGKREAAMESRGTKYADQKGGGKIAKSRRSAKSGGFKARPHDKEERDEDNGDDEDEMVVVRGGTAIRTGGDSDKDRSSNTKRDRVRDDEEEDEEATQRFTSVEKKLRALTKKLRAISDLKQRRKQGMELNAGQQAKLRTEKELLDQVQRFTQQAADAVSDGHVEPPQPPQPPPLHVASPLSAPGEQRAVASKLQQRRQEKQRRHLLKLQQKAER